MNRDQRLPPLISPLVNYALKGLQKCWLPDHGRWSHVYHLDGREPPNESLAQSDVFYTLNVLLGCARVQQLPRTIDVLETFRLNVQQLLRLPVEKYAFGMALWAAAELKLDVPIEVVRYLKDFLSKKKNWQILRAQDLGLILTGVAAQARIDPKQWNVFADELFAFLIERYRAPSGLFFDAPIGLRRRFASFASQTYLTLACYSYGELAHHCRAIEIANACTRKLIDLQGPNGEWPWFFDAKNGLILDFYEVYSVHQCGMAPAFLERAEHHSVPGARDALIRGFNWILGHNQLARPMLVPQLQMTIRSQVRKRELYTKNFRMIRALRNASLGLSPRLTDPADVRLRLECRSYELGWILWSFGHRSDLPQLTHNQFFGELPSCPEHLRTH
jgi:hypothetical protein